MRPWSRPISWSAWRLCQGNFWRGKRWAEVEYQDMPGFCKSATLEEIARHGVVLTPGRYVGAEETEDDEEAFGEKMDRMTSLLAEQFAERSQIEQTVREKLGVLGYAV